MRTSMSGWVFCGVVRLLGWLGIGRLGVGRLGVARGGIGQGGIGQGGIGQGGSVPRGAHRGGLRDRIVGRRLRIALRFQRHQCDPATAVGMHAPTVRLGHRGGPEAGASDDEVRLPLGGSVLGGDLLAGRVDAEEASSLVRSKS